MDDVEIRLLGPLEALHEGVPVRIGAPRQRALLALLALSAGRAVSASSLIDGLWGETVPVSAAKMVQILVSQLRKVLPPDVLVTRAPGYQLDVPRGRVDAFRAEERLRGGRDALAQGDPRAASELLSGALALWRGQALAEFGEPFSAEARRLEELQLSLTEERIEAELALGRNAEEVGRIETLIARHPLRERLRGQLMLALYRCDRQAEALAAYQETRRVLADELGIDPSPALRDLERRILQQDPGLAPTPVPVPAPQRAASFPARTLTPIVGRAAEFAALGEHLGAVLAGEPRLVLVSGEAGAGKTTLIESFLSDAGAEEGLVVGHGQCIEQHGASEAYMPVLEALDRLCRASGAEALVPLAVERAPTWIVQMPWLVGSDELARVRERIVGATQERMLREIVEALMAAAAERPIVLVLEDLHWADPSTLTLLTALARRRDAARLLIIGTLRSADAATRAHPVHGLVADLAPRGLCAHVEVGALAEADVAQYLDVRVPGAALPPALCQALMDRTGGNPLFLEKAVDSWVEDGKVRREEDGWRVADPDGLARGVPLTVRQLIRRRLLSVDPKDRQILEAASVAAPEFSAALAAAACDRPAEEVEGRCDELAREGILLAPRGAECWPDGTIAGRFGFTHDLCHEVLYEDLPAGRRARLHMAAGARLEAAFGEHAQEVAPVLAAHFIRGGDPERALRHVRTAAGQALERLAPREAIELLATGLELLRELREGRERMEHELAFLNMQGPALIATQGWASPTAEAAFARAGELARSLGRPDEAAWSTYKLATLYEARGEYERSETLLMTEVMAEPVVPDGAPGLVDSHELLACSLFHQGAFGRALESAERGLEAYDDTSSNAFIAAYGDNPGINCHSWAALSLWHLGRPDAARARAAMSVGLAEDARRRHGMAMALVLSATVTQCRREPDETRELAERGIGAAAYEGFIYPVAMGTVLRGWAMAARGSPEEGIAELRRGIELSRAAGARMDDTYFLGLLADALIGVGEHGEALGVLGEALVAVPRGGRFFYDAELHRLQSEVLHGLGRTEEAEAALRRALGSARQQGGRSLELRSAVSLGRLLRDTGRPREAQALVAAAYGTFGEGFETPDLRGAAAFLAQGSGAVPGPAEPAPAVRYARSGDLSIAYEVTGHGPLDLVLVPGFLSHLEMDRREPRHTRFLDRLAAMARLIRFDKRGTGMSDRPPGLPDLETRMDDLRAVMESAGSERAVLFGYSEGGPLSIVFAATYPERVRGLVLFGSFAKRLDPDDDYPWAPTREQRARHLERLAGDWRFEEQMRAMCPSADDAMTRWWAERCRAAATPGAVRALLEMNARIDVRDLLPAIHVPTLVVHRGADGRVRVEESRYIAERIPGARLVELPGADHFVGIDPDQILDAVEPFVVELSEAPADAGSTRVLATVVATDAPGAPALSLFDGPSRAIRSGLATAARLGRSGAPGRVGVHTGEVERASGTPGGPAVAIAKAVAAAAAQGEVLVTATTRDLVAGSGLAFEDRGERSFGGGLMRRVFAAREGGSAPEPPIIPLDRADPVAAA